jgi:DNA-binding LytR/AlgR family response regulator
MSEQVRLLDRDGKPCTVSVADIIAIRPTSDGPELYTKDAVYYFPSTLEEFQILFEEFGFVKLDRTNLVNLNNVQVFDSKARKVYFEYPWSENSKFATVSEANVHKVERFTKEDQSEYKVSRKPLFGNS